MEVPVPRKTPFWHTLSFKLIVVGVLILLMLIPWAMIRELIREREQTQADVISEIGSKWGGGQILAGPVLTIPYYVYVEEEEKTHREIRHAHFLPEELDMDVSASPEILKRGMYKSVVYRSRVKVSGSFIPPDPGKLKIESGNMLPQDAFVQFGIPDMRGIQEITSFNWNGQQIQVESGIPVREVLSSGFHTKVPIQKADGYKFSFELTLNGSAYLYFMPAGKITRISMESSWAHPKFDGAFLPDEREVGPSGFTASWKVLHLNRNFPQYWKGEGNLTEDSAFGVDLILPVDRYQKTMRSAKYAILFIALTFMIFFFVEVLNKKRIHPIQYLLVGLSISIFYVLLLSLSEQIGFNPAYGISAVAVVGLITAYSASIFKNARLTAIMGVCLVLLYAFLFSLIQLRDYALLLGSIGLFVVMALIMYASRNVDWYSATSVKDKDHHIGF